MAGGHRVKVYAGVLARVALLFVAPEVAFKRHAHPSSRQGHVTLVLHAAAVLFMSDLFDDCIIIMFRRKELEISVYLGSEVSSSHYRLLSIHVSVEINVT